MADPQRLPIVNSDDGTWGGILRQYLMKEHVNDDTDNPLNGGHKNVTIAAGSSGVGGAPLKFTSGALLSSPESGAMEFYSNDYYLTNASGRKKIATFGGSTGDLYYNNSGAFTSLSIGSTGDILTVNSGVPTWQSLASSGVGNVNGPGSSTDNAVARFDGTTGKLIQNSTVTIADSTGDMAGVGKINSKTLPSSDFVGTTDAQALTNKDMTSGTNTWPTFNQNTTGNAATATKLATGRTIQTSLGSTSAVSFDGTTNITPGVTGTLPIDHGGTASTTQQAAIDNLTVPASKSGQYLRSDGTHAAFAAIDPGDVPNLNQDTTGNAATSTVTTKLATARTFLTNLASTSAASFDGTANVTPGVTGTLPIANGGTAGTTQQVALDNLTIPASKSGQYLRSNGTNTTFSAIQAGDVPTLNQSTTGNAATATKLATARTINGVSFDGTANITIPAGTDWAAQASSATAVVGKGYITTSGSLVTLTLPSTFAVGDTIRVAGTGSGGWKIAQPSGDNIRFLDITTTTGTSGYLASTTNYDAVELVGTVADTTWNVISSVGNIEVN